MQIYIYIYIYADIHTCIYIQMTVKNLGMRDRHISLMFPNEEAQRNRHQRQGDKCVFVCMYAYVYECYTMRHIVVDCETH